MTNNKPPVAPKEGFYAMLRNGEVIGPMRKEYEDQDWFVSRVFDGYDWQSSGAFFVDGDPHGFDIIATISPEAMNEAVALSQQPSQEELSKGRVVSRFEWGDIPKMNPEGHDLAAKVWNERYVEAVKTSAKNSEIYREQIDVIADEVHSLRASLQNIRNIALERLADGKQDATVKKIELISRRTLLGDEV